MRKKAQFCHNWKIFGYSLSHCAKNVQITQPMQTTNSYNFSIDFYNKNKYRKNDKFQPFQTNSQNKKVQFKNTFNNNSVNNNHNPYHREQSSSFSPSPPSYNRRSNNPFAFVQRHANTECTTHPKNKLRFSGGRRLLILLPVNRMKM